MKDRDIKFEAYKIPDYEPIEIRFDATQSFFYAKFFEREFTDPDLNKLKKQLVDEAESRKKITWKPVILIGTAQGIINII